MKRAKLVDLNNVMEFPFGFGHVSLLQNIDLTIVMSHT